MKKMLFLPAAGVPSRVYSALFEVLTDHYDVSFPELLGASDAYPADAEWKSITREAAQYLESETPVILGHSMGAMVALFLAAQYPEKIGRLALLDPALVIGPARLGVGLLKMLGQEDRVFPSGSTLQRQSIWESATDVKKYLHSKRFYASWDDASLDNFVEYGTRQTAAGRELVFPVEKENGIYKTTPLMANRIPPLGLSGSVAITGKESPVTRLPGVKRFFRKHGIKHKLFPGGHMFPLEKPVALGESLLGYLAND